LDHLDSQGNTGRVGEISGLTPGTDGLVTLWLDTARLQPGRHTVELTSEKADAAAPAEHFIIELVR
jgi:hypothetical protein